MRNICDTTVPLLPLVWIKLLISKMLCRGQTSNPVNDLVVSHCDSTVVYHSPRSHGATSIVATLIPPVPDNRRDELLLDPEFLKCRLPHCQSSR